MSIGSITTISSSFPTLESYLVRQQRATRIEQQSAGNRSVQAPVQPQIRRDLQTTRSFNDPANPNAINANTLTDNTINANTFDDNRLTANRLNDNRSNTTRLNDTTQSTFNDSTLYPNRVNTSPNPLVASSRDANSLSSDTLNTDPLSANTLNQSLLTTPLNPNQAVDPLTTNTLGVNRLADNPFAPNSISPNALNNGINGQEFSQLAARFDFNQQLAQAPQLFG